MLNYTGLSPIYLQIVYLPVVMLFLYSCKFLKLPFLLFAFATIIPLLWFYLITQKQASSRTIALMGQFSDDLYGKKSRIFNYQLNKALRKENIGSAELLSYASDYSDAQLMLDNNQGVSFVLFGDVHKINLAQKAKIASLRSYPLSKDLPLELSFTKTISVFSLPLKPQSETIKYLQYLLNSQHSSKIKKEALLRSAAAFRLAWNESQHLAYSRFLIGNLLLEELLNSNEYQPALVECIKKAWDRAAKLSRLKQNPELVAALHNNRAVLRYLVMSLDFKKHKQTKKIKKQFKSAITVLQYENPYKIDYLSPFIARINLKMLKEHYGYKKKNKRQSK